MVSMNNCPICYTELIVKEVTPCYECGGFESELDHFKEHTYKEYRSYFDNELVLCNFCEVDFSSINPTYFGFSKFKKIGLSDFEFIREVKNKGLVKDKYCPECNHILKFLKVVNDIRQNNL